MKRTSLALRRFGVPVLAATTLFSVGQVALGTSAFAATNGALSISNTPSFNSATDFGVSDEADHTITWTAGTSSVNPAAPQVLNITVSGSATIVDPGGTGTISIAAGGKSATCTSTVPAGGTATCDYGIVDKASEVATSTVHNTTDTTTPDATATDNYSSLFFSNCATTAPQIPANCATQIGNGTAQTYTVTYMQAGVAANNVGLLFTLSPNAHTIFTTPQPAGTTFSGGNTATCTTVNGQCQVSITGTSVGNNDVLDVQTTTNTGSYPASDAEQKVNVIASTVPGRLVLGSSTRITPTSGQTSDAKNIPGDALENHYTLYSCNADATGFNACTAGSALAGVQVALSVDHGFFTPNCTASAYTGCTFDPAAAVGGKVGALKSLGATTTVTTDTNGQFTVTLGIGKDAGFDDDGSLIAQVKGTASGVTLTESDGTGHTATPVTCNTVGQSGVANNVANISGNNFAPQAGCPTGTPWTTDARPLNGGAVSIEWLTTPKLSKTSTNEIPDNPNGNGSPVNVFVLHATDQFGNLVTTHNDITITSAGGGELGYCDGYQDTAAHSQCDEGTVDTGNISQPNGVTTFTIPDGVGSYTALFDANGDPAQERYWVWADTDETGMQTLTATWDAPVTTFATVTPAITYATSTNTVTDKTVNDYFAQKPTTFTFSVTPSNTVHAGTVVTVSATVKDQHGNGIADENVQFIRSGPQTQSGTSCTADGANPNTNENGQAGFSFTCTNPSTQVVTIVVTDNSGNELARSTQTIHFTGRVHITASINCFSPHRHKVTCKVHVSPRFSGLTVIFFNKAGHKVGSATTNSHGNARLHLSGLRSGRHHSYHAHVRRSGRTFGANTGSDGVTVK